MRARGSVLLVGPLSRGHHVPYAVDLARGLVRQGLTVSVAGDGAWADAVAAVVDVAGRHVVPYDDRERRWGRNLWAKLRFVQRCLELADSTGVETVHLLYLDRFIVPLLTVLALRRRRPPGMRATLHWGYVLPEFSSGWWRARKAALESRALRWIFASAREFRLLVHSAELRDRLVTHLGVQDIDAVPYPVDPTFPGREGLAGQRDAFRSRIGVPETAALLLAFGGTRRDKGVDLAVRALAKLSPEVHLLVAGPAIDFDRESLRSMAERIRVSDRLHLDLRFVPDEEVPVCFGAAEAVILPYRTSFAGESGPLTIAAGMGIPVIAPDTVAIGASVRSYGLGALFEPEDVDSLVGAVARALDGSEPQHSDRYLRDHSPEAFAREVALSYAKTGVGPER